MTQPLDRAWQVGDIPRVPLRAMIAVAIGGAAGSVARYGVASVLQRRRPTTFPTATLAVNIAGSFVLGVLVGTLTANTASVVGARLFLETGVCGGFTTFSAFSYETVVLVRDGRGPTAAVYVMSSLVLGITAAAAGLLLTR
jgi:fluoride exporter